MARGNVLHHAYGTLLLLVMCRLTTPSRPKSIITQAASLHVDQFGPVPPEASFNATLSKAALYVASSASPPDMPPGGTNSGGTVAPCIAFRLVLLTLGDEEQMESLVTPLIRDLSKIPLSARGYVSAPRSPLTGTCARPPMGNADAAVASEAGSQGSAQAGEGSISKDHLDDVLVVVSVDPMAMGACRKAQLKFGHSCQETAHVSVSDLRSFARAERSAALSFAKVRLVLNALTLGFGVLYLDPKGARGIRLDPLPSLLASKAGFVHAADADRCAYREEEAAESGMAGVAVRQLRQLDAMSDAGRGIQGVGGSASDADALVATPSVLLMRPSAASVRCTFDWMTSMWGGRRVATGSSGSLAEDAAGKDLEEGLQGGSKEASLKSFEGRHYSAVIPECAGAFGVGLELVATGAFSADECSTEGHG